MIKALAHATGRSIITIPLAQIKTNQMLFDIMYDLKALLKSSNNAVPPELERHEASRVKPMRDGKGGWGAKMTREQMQGMQEIIH